MLSWKKRKDPGSVIKLEVIIQNYVMKKWWKKAWKIVWESKSLTCIHNISVSAAVSHTTPDQERSEKQTEDGIFLYDLRNLRKHIITDKCIIIVT